MHRERLASLHGLSTLHQYLLLKAQIRFLVSAGVRLIYELKDNNISIRMYIYGHVYLVCLSNSVCGTTTGTFSWHQPYIDYMLTIFWPNMIKYWANMIKYQQNITKTIKYMSIISRNVIFSKSKNPTSKINQGFVFCWGTLGYMGGGRIVKTSRGLPSSQNTFTGTK